MHRETAVRYGTTSTNGANGLIPSHESIRKCATLPSVAMHCQTVSVLRSFHSSALYTVAALTHVWLLQPVPSVSPISYPAHFTVPHSPHRRHRTPDSSATDNRQSAETARLQCRERLVIAADNTDPWHKLAAPRSAAQRSAAQRSTAQVQSDTAMTHAHSTRGSFGRCRTPGATVAVSAAAVVLVALLHVLVATAPAAHAADPCSKWGRSLKACNNQARHNNCRWFWGHDGCAGANGCHANTGVGCPAFSCFAACWSRGDICQWVAGRGCIAATDAPTPRRPSGSPSRSPMPAPTASPTAAPTTSPTAAPTTSPVAAPTASPTSAPTTSPVAAPTASPTSAPTASPTAAPTTSPTSAPTTSPTASPTPPQVVVWGSANHGGSLARAVSSSAAPPDVSIGVVDIIPSHDTFTVIKEDGSIVQWPRRSGFPTGVYGSLSARARKVVATHQAFAALLDDTSVRVWGGYDFGGATGATDLSSGVLDVAANKHAFVAIMNPLRTLRAWGNKLYGGSFSTPTDVDCGAGVDKIFSTSTAFVALRQDGSLCAWGAQNEGGSLGFPTSNVATVWSTSGAFLALRDDNTTVYVWGGALYGGRLPSPAPDFSAGVQSVATTYGAFAVLLASGAVIAWGPNGAGGQIPGDVDVSGDVLKVFANEAAFAALKKGGKLVVWGSTTTGGSLTVPTDVTGEVASGVIEVVGTANAFAALKEDGNVVVWGEASQGGSLGSVAPLVASGVVQLFSTENAFAALKHDGSVVAWGSWQGGGSINVPVNPGPNLDGGVETVYATGRAFLAVR